MREEEKKLLQVWGISGIIILLLAGGIIWWWMSNARTTTPSADTASNSEVQATPNEAQIQITTNGFIPAELSVTPNTKVVWINATNSNQHVIATDTAKLTGLDSQTIAAGKSYVFTFEHTGNFTFENAASPLQHGIVHVINP